MKDMLEIKTQWASLFYGKDGAGSGRLQIDERETDIKAQAIVSPELMLSKIAQGFDEEKAGLLKGDAKPLVTAICLGYLQRRKAACEDEREKIELETQIRQLTLAGVRVELVETRFKNMFHKRGARGVEALAKLVKTVERKSRHLTPKERDFIKALEEAAIKAKGVPYQKDVREKWLAMDLEEAEDATFYTLKRRLGFGWLPAGTRGKKGVQK